MLVGIYPTMYVDAADPSLVYCSSPIESPLLRTTTSSPFPRDETLRTCSMLVYALYSSYE